MAPHPTFRCSGADRYVGLPRVWFVCAADAEAARAHAQQKGLVAPAVERIETGEVPRDATVLLARAASADQSPGVVARRTLRVVLGLALGLFVIAGFLFVMKAKEHLLRDRGRTPPGVSAAGSGSARQGK